MNTIFISIITVIVATGLGLLSNIVANKIQPHLEKKKRLTIILFSVLLGAAIAIAIVTSYTPSDSKPPASDNLNSPISDALKIISIKTVEDSQTQISELAGKGVISVYWEVLLSNVGNTNLSVISYDVKQIGQDFPAIFYSGMNQGLYSFEDGKYKQLDLPIDLSAGSTRRVFVRLGLLTTPESFKLIKENFSNSTGATLKTIWRFLFSKGTDFYGNKIESLPEGAGHKLPDKDQLHEQVFLISFKTSRGSSVEETISWYKYGGAFDPRRYQ